MAVTHKTICVTLTTTLTTALLTAGSGKRLEIDLFYIGVSSSSGTITASVTDTSGSVTSRIWNGSDIDKNNPLEIRGLRLEATDILKGGHTGTTDAEAMIVYSEYDA